MKPIVLDAEEILKAITEGTLEKADDLLAALDKDTTMSDADKQSVVGALRLLKGIDKLPAEVHVALKQFKPFGEDEDDDDGKKGKKGAHLEEEEEKKKKEAAAKEKAAEEKAAKTKKAATEVPMPVRKEDGSFDLTGVPEDQRPFFQALAKENADANARSEQLEKDLKVERDAREIRDYTDRVNKEFENIPGKVVEKAAMLKEAYEVSKDFGDRMASSWTAQEAALKVANEALLTSHGHTAFMGDGTGAEARLNAMAKELAAKENISFYAAYEKVLDQNQETYALHKTEKGAI